MAKDGVSLRKKISCSVAIVAASLLIIFVFCGRFFHSALKDVANFFVGCFGMSFYGMMIAVIVACSFMVTGKNIRVPTKYAVHFFLMFLEIVLLVHLFSTLHVFKNSANFSDYAGYVYHYYSGVPTFGGIVFGTIAYGLQKVITIYGAAVLLFGLLAWSVYCIGNFFYCYFTGKLTLTKKPADVPTVAPEITETVVEEDERSRAYKILFNHESTPQTQQVDQYDTAHQSTLGKGTMPKTRSEVESFLFGGGSTYVAEDDADSEEDTTNDEMGVKGYSTPANEDTRPSADQSWRITRPVAEEKPANGKKSLRTDSDGWVVTDSDEVDIADVVTEQPVARTEQTIAETTQPQVVSQPIEEYSSTDESDDDYDFDQAEDDIPFDEQDDDDYSDQVEDTPVVAVQQPKPQPTVASQTTQSTRRAEDELIPITKETAVPGGIQMGFDFQTEKELKDAQSKLHKYPKYVTPPTDLLNDAVITEDTDSEYRVQAAQAIVNKLAIFGIKIESVETVVGPTVTRFLFKVTSQRTRMSDFKQYSADLKACLEAQDEIRIQAPVEGTNLVGIEVANKVRTPVMLRSLLESKTYKEGKGALLFPIGQEISGEIILADLAKLPHLLVAGSTGSGKSVFLNTLITSLMFRYGPEYLRFVMVDPKFVELSRYNGIPHMLTTETITNQTDAIGAMDYLINEMEARYMLFKQNAVANIAEYNAKINPKMVQKMPYLVFVVDELADLMSVCKQQFEAKLQRLAQKARAAGIHMVLATQRPDVKTITGTIKTNLPCRIAFKVTSSQDSITILGQGGAEKLLGNGDMLYLNPHKAGFARCQGAYISNEEISAFVQFSKEENEVYYDPKISDEIFVSRQAPDDDEISAPQQSDENKEESIDPYCKKALRFWLVRNRGNASIASIQRGLKIGFNRAGRIMDQLQSMHYVEALQANEPSSKPLKVLVTNEELDTLFPDLDDFI